MQVNNESTITSIVPNDKSLLLTQGSQFQAEVKEQLPDNEAILQIRGKNVKVRVEGQLPSHGKVEIEVVNTDQALPTVKVIGSNNQNPTSTRLDSTSLIEGLNITPSLKEDLKKAVGILSGKGIPVTMETISQLASFIEKESGTIVQKLETVEAMAKKRLDFTRNQLKSVHEALHGQKFNDLLRELVPEIQRQAPLNGKVFVERDSIEYEEVMKQIHKALKNSNISEAIKLSENIESSLPENLKKLLLQAKQIYQASSQGLVNSLQTTDPNFLLTVTGMIEKGDSIELEEVVKSNLLRELQSLDNVPKAMLEVQQAINSLKKEPNIQDVFTMIKSQLIESSNLSPAQSEKLQNSLAKANHYSETGRELAARQELLGSLEEWQKANDIDQVQEGIQGQDIYELHNDFLGSLPVQSKDFIVSTITKKLSQMSIDFKDIKRDITKNLQTIQNLIDKHKNIAIPQVKPLLEATIKQLDQAILKGDFLLYTDMGTEKKLLKASSQLAEATKMLGKGDIHQASNIVNEVKTMMDKLMFKPSDTRMQHFVSKQLFQLEQPSLANQIAYTMDNSMGAIKENPTSRQMFEHLKNLGLTYESDLAHSLISNGKSQEGHDQSLKSLLLKYNQSDVTQTQMQKADQMLTQITGQQLLSKTDPSNLQSMMFTLPFLLQDQAEQVKVFVNSKNEQQKVDWENCSLYFHLETRKLGDVGIALSSLDRTLSVTIKNDKPDFKEKIEPIAVKAKERLEQIGYRIGNIQFSKFSIEEKIEVKKNHGLKTTLPKFSEKGYDFTV